MEPKEMTVTINLDDLWHLKSRADYAGYLEKQVESLKKEKEQLNAELSSLKAPSAF